MDLFYIFRFEIAFIPSLETGAFGIIRGKQKRPVGNSTGL